MKVLLIVDLQKQFKVSDGRYDNILNNLERIKSNYDKVIATVFSQTVNGEVNTNYLDKLHWSDCTCCSAEDLEFGLLDIQVISKNGYGLKNIERYFSKEDEIDIIGCDSDACVMAICFQLFDLGYNFNVLSKYIYTSSKVYDDSTVIEFLKRNFGDCVK